MEAHAPRSPTAVPDEARLSELVRTGLLDSPPEEAFDRVTRLAARVLRAPQAFVSLVDRDRQFLKSRAAADGPGGGVRELSLGLSFCRHVVDGGEPLVVADARRHPLLRDNPAIEQHGAIAYAGVPFVSGGHVLGTLCVIDRHSRRWTAEEVDILRDLAATLMTETELRIEVSARRGLERELRRSHGQLERLIDNSPAVIFAKDLEGRYMFVNREFERVFGIPRADAAGQTDSDFFPPEMAAALRANDRAVIERGAPLEMEETAPQDDGVHSYLSLKFPLLDEDGEPYGVCGISTDMTEARRVQDELRAARDLLAGVLDAATESAIIGTDPEGVITVFNSGAERMLGYRADELVGRATPARLHDAAEVAARAAEMGVEPGRDVFQTAARSGTPETREWTWIARDGTRRIVSLTVTAIRGGEGAVEGFMGLATDVTEHRAAERARDEERRFLRAVLDNLKDGIVACDADGVPTVFNPATEAMHGLPAESLPPERWADHYDLLDADGAPLAPDRVPLRRALAGEHLRDAEMRIAPRGRDARVVLASGQPILGADGSTLGAVVAMHDITERRRAEMEAERLKNEFFALVSHELRTPLTSIAGYLELLLEEDEPLTAHQRGFLEVVDRNTARLRRLVGDLLFVAQFEAGKLALEPGAVNVGEAAAQAVEAAGPQARELGVEVELDAEPVPSGSGDPDRIAQVIDNVLSNALKFTPQGGRVRVRVRDLGRHCAVEVADTGIGIPADQQQRLFERFYRASAATERSIPGMGLGLSIARAIVEGHGGSIAVESAEGAGTTFRIELPVEPRLGATSAGAASAAPPA